MNIQETPESAFNPQSAEIVYWQLRQNSAKTSPKEITLERYMEKIGVMYPLDWQGTIESESFKLAEMFLGSITNIYAKVNDRYFEFRDEVTLTHREIVEKINKEVFSK